MARPSVSGFGHASLDRDHDLLFLILGNLKPALDIGSDVGADTRALFGVELLAYAEAHFEHEEQLMERYRYPGKAAHQEEHERFRKQAYSLVRACVTPNSPLGPLVAAVEDWIDTHMREADARLAEFLNSCNVERCGADSGLFADADCLVPGEKGATGESSQEPRARSSNQ